MPAPLSPDETARLAQLRLLDILDSPAEASLDRIAKLAAGLMRAPIALISLIEESRESFRARHGVDIQETPREGALGAQAILAAEPFVILDASLDRRFTGNPLVDGPPKIRFYAAAPIRIGQGVPLGVLAVADPVSRSAVSQEELTALADLAALVSDQLGQRVEEGRRQAIQERLEQLTSSYRSVLGQIREAVFWCGEHGRLIALNDHWTELFGVSARDSTGRLLTEFLRPQDQKVAEDALTSVFNGSTPAVQTAVRYASPAGRCGWVEMKLCAFATPEGRVREIVGTLFDVTESRQRLQDEQATRLILDGVSRVQARFIEGQPQSEVFGELARVLLASTGTSYAYLGEVEYQPGSALSIRNLAHAGPPGRWAPGNGEAVDPGTPLGAAIAKVVLMGEPVFAGEAPDSFVAVPCRHGSEIVGVVAIAGGEENHDSRSVERLQTFLLSCGSLIWAARARTFGRQTAAALRLRDRALASISSAVAITAFEGSGVSIIYCNAAFERMTGYSAEEILGGDFRIIEGPETDPATIAAIAATAADGREGEFTIRNHRKDGTTFWNRFRMSPVIDQEGAVTHYVSICDDITEKRQFEEQLAESEARKSAILRAALDCIITTDHRGRIVEFNPAAEETFGYSSQQAAGRDLAELIVPQVSPAPDEQGFAGGASWFPPMGERVEMTAVRADGTRFPIEIALAAIEQRNQSNYTAYLRDLTPAKNAEKELQETLSMQRAILNGASYTIISADERGVVQAFNQAATRLLGYSANEVIGKANITQFHRPEELALRAIQLSAELGYPVAPDFEACSAKARHGSTDETEWNYVRKDGSIFPVLLSTTALQDQQGNSTVFLMIGGDITERRKAQEEQLKFVSLVENSSDFIGMATLDWKAFYVNRSGRELVGIDTPEDVARKRIPSFVTKETWAMVRKMAMPELVATGAWAGEGQLRHFKTGKTIHVLMTFFMVRDSKTGAPLCIATVQRDITERKRAERALREEKDFSETLIRSSLDGIFAFDRQCRVTAWNPAMEQFSGMTRDAALGQSAPDLFPFLKSSGEDRRFREALEGTSGVSKDQPYGLPATGKQGYFEAYYSPLLGTSGEITGGLAVVRDTTARREAEVEMTRAKDAAEAAARSKSQFLANMSHEIRTPMNAVIGMTGVLLDTNLNLEQRDYVDTIRSAGEALLSIINEILDFSKAESGVLELEMNPFDLRAAIENALDLLTARAAEKNLDMGYVLEPTMPAMLVGDVGRLRQILVNLLSNAVKFTSSGHILVSVNAQALDTSKHRIHFAVQDTGMGIPGDKLEQIFESFSQVDASTTRQHGGTGLGLAISKRLCEVMGGEIWVESVLGKGSTFHFTIVADAAGTATAGQMTEGLSPLTGKRLLVVDSSPCSRLVIKEHTELWGMQPAVFSSLTAAQDAVHTGNNYDVAMIDIDLPGLDVPGLEKLRAKGPLVLMHSIGSKKEMLAQMSLQALGTLSHARPIRPSLLYNSLVTLFDGHPVQMRGGSRVSHADPHMAERLPLRILVAEDNAVNQKLALLLLSRMGYRADVADNGLEALRSLKRQPYDVVFMDMQMPELDGIGTTRQIHALWPPEKRPWIIAMTANAMRADREQCLQSGMDDYLSKPVQASDLKAALERFGETRMKSMAGPGWNMPDYMAELFEGDDKQLGIELVEMFLSEMTSKLSDLRTALAEGQEGRVKKLAHSIKGSCSQMGADSMADLARQLESTPSPELAARIEKEFEQTQAEIKQWITEHDLAPREARS